MATTLILGATGRVGRALVALLQARDVPVCALVRDAVTGREALGTRVRLVEGDLRDDVAVARAADGCVRIAFVAGALGGSGRGTPREIEFEGLRAVIAATRSRMLDRFVLLSSAGVTQPEHPHNCTGNGVLRWKWQGEEILRRSGQPYTIVRALGLRQREPGLHGVRMVQGDRIAFGEDIAIADTAAFLADVIAPREPSGFEAGFEQRSLLNATCEIYTDTTLPGGLWSFAESALLVDRQPA